VNQLEANAVLDAAKARRYTVEVSADELLVLEAALGRRVAAKPVPAKRPAARRSVHGKPPKLTDTNRRRGEADWAQAVEKGGEWWRTMLATQAARPTGRATAEDVMRAWGLK